MYYSLRDVWFVFSSTYQTLSSLPGKHSWLEHKRSQKEKTLKLWLKPWKKKSNEMNMQRLAGDWRKAFIYSSQLNSSKKRGATIIRAGATGRVINFGSRRYAAPEKPELHPTPSLLNASAIIILSRHHLPTITLLILLLHVPFRFAHSTRLHFTIPSSSSSSFTAFSTIAIIKFSSYCYYQETLIISKEAMTSPG